ncbi:MAG TPA: hypothetical protein VF881_12145 [Polyangiaceae bacterium]
MTPQRLKRLIYSVILLSAGPASVTANGCGGAVTSQDPNDPSGSGGNSGSSSGQGGSEPGTTGTSTGSGGWDTTTITTIGTGGNAGWGGDAGAGGTSWGGSAGSAGWGGSGGTDRCSISPPAPCYSLPYSGEIPSDCVALDGGWPDGGALDYTTCSRLCGVFQGFVSRCDVQPSSSSTDLRLTCQSFCGVGRRPPGLEEANVSADLGAYFEAMAQLEAASVDAFRILRRELAGHRLPRRLDRAMRRAARDEVRHARAARALGRRFGGTYAPPVVKAQPRRTLEAIAIDNAIEGCVRETYGALVATFQAKMARDAQVRAAMTRIARDEIRHAALSWQLDHWLSTRLDAEGREQVACAKRAARTELAASLGAAQASDVLEVAGLPPPEVARELLDHLSQALDG